MKPLVKIAALVAMVVAVATLNGCKITYNTSGAQIDPKAQTFSVGFFPNNAPGMGSPTLSNTFTEALRNRLLRQTRLSQIDEGGDLAFEGEITGFDVQPAAIGANETAQLNRLTITVRVRFTNVQMPEWSFEDGQNFSANAEYDASQLLSNVEGPLIEEIVETLVDNIFNASVANW